MPKEKITALRQRLYAAVEEDCTKQLCFGKEEEETSLYYSEAEEPTSPREDEDEDEHPLTIKYEPIIIEETKPKKSLEVRLRRFGSYSGKKKTPLPQPGP